MTAVRSLLSYLPAKVSPAAPVLPMSRAEMKQLGWDACDVILVTGDAYVDHPSFGMAVIGRVLERAGYRVGIISQPDWHSKDDFMQLGRPRLFFGVTAGNMDSMINRYTAERRLRHDDAYTAGGEGGKRPDRAVVAYAQRCREAYKGVPLVLGGIEASLRRIAHYDYWSDKVRRSVLPDAKADLLLYGNAERALLEVAERLDQGEPVSELTDIRGTAVMRSQLPGDWTLIDSTDVDQPGLVVPPQNPYQEQPDCETNQAREQQAQQIAAQPVEVEPQPLKLVDLKQSKFKPERDRSYIRLPAYEVVSKDPVMYAHASRVMHLETNPGNARALVQRHGNRDLWVNPPPVPLSTREIDAVFDLPYNRLPHPDYGDLRIPAYEMIRFSINIMRGCFGGCSFCSITEHEGRIIQNRSEASILGEIEAIRDKVPGFTGTISDLGGPTANMYRLACKDEKIEAACRRLSCVHPGICVNMKTDHRHLTQLYRKARKIPGVKRILIASGLRYDLAVEDPEYLRELVTHHVGGYLKIAPEHTEDGPLSLMMKPGMGTYYRFKKLFEKVSREAGKKQYLIPYFISAHPGTRDEDMVNLALWLKQNDFKLDQVQNFIPSPMCNATTMYHSNRNPLKKVRRNDKDPVVVPKGGRQRRTHKAILRYHDPDNWPLIRETLKRIGRSDLIGRHPDALVPPEGRKPVRSPSKGRPALTQGDYQARRKKPKRQQSLKRDGTQASAKSGQSTRAQGGIKKGTGNSANKGKASAKPGTIRRKRS
ncbi:YgiQ family radical SAM protein [Motiliproteus coralliicola]|uniref:YgiQ family radical SAM protein n=1 Tax=Motiliproteus coralliicola TaxID=2283196 RepID=A0A369WS15_9GAMM|nr:YgiQ family radical SAM protein [Motiliproteus coralliicola]RDE24918.1 YgiQ family radical SAM protein [Motiliproteus coralliicola]